MKPVVNRNPLISIIVPVYNVEPYLERCVRSLTQQTYSFLEILLIDDGSTDGSQDICETLAQTDSRIHVVHEKNAGPSHARNEGLSRAKGAYIGFVDADDYVESDHYELLFQATQRDGVKVAQIGRFEETVQGERLPDICTPPKDITMISAEFFLNELLLHKGDCSFCTKLFTRDILMGKHFLEGALNEDFRLLVEILTQIDAILLLPKQTYHVNYRADSNTRKKTNQEFSRVYQDGVENADWVAQYVATKYPRQRKAALRFGVYQRLEYFLHIPIALMNKDNEQYVKNKRWLRYHWFTGLTNRHLTIKNKCYMSAFVLAPKLVRLLHRIIRLSK
ncbi:MAG: glycosyltransferase [Lachnospiraceae bacterium]|jgi:glycosyltransferase involved in cell wall biosynthesis|nr:glycosyltransferase [Lachnospiraceae bacterium]